MMRIIAAVLVLAGLYPHANGQENPPATQAVAASVGLEIGQPAPAFALSDQFGHENSSETLKRPKGTVLLFFRSADW
jgi:cytochrome oxidase Cu insertion factor (SCO1/SenC/PrrC family)